MRRRGVIGWSSWGVELGDRRSRAAWLWAVLVVVAALIPGLARAESPCSDAVVEWVEGCARTRGRSLVADACPSGMLIVRAQLDPGEDSELRVELRRPARGAMLALGELGVSAIGEFPRWADAPAPIRAAFDDVVECARASPPPAFTVGPPRPRYAPPVRPPENDAGEGREPLVAELEPVAIPWLCLAGLLGLTIVLVRTGPPIRRRELWLGLALAGCGVALAAMLDWSYFLQNGHGPEWVRYALTGDEGLGTYGPGYAELLGGLVRLRPAAPEGLVAGLYLGLVAAMIAIAFVAARSVGARSTLAAAIAVAAVLEPTCLRLVRSAAYHPPIFALEWAAALALVLGARRTDLRAPSFWIAALAAGLLVAQAARVHPVGWVGLATLPAVVVFVPGPTRTRALQAVAAAVVIALAVGLGSREVLLGALETSAGRAALIHVPVARAMLGFGIVAALALALVLARPTAGVRRVLIVGLVGVAVSLAVSIDPLRGELWRYRAGYYACLGPTVGLGIAALAGRLGRSTRAQRLIAVVVVVAAGLSAGLTGPARTAPATDACESTWAVDWRARDLGARRVIYLASVHGRMVRLPLHDPDGLVARELALHELSTVHLTAPTLYYRSSSCSTVEARAACDALETRLHVEAPALLEAELPAIVSQPGTSFDVDVVRVGLYLVGPPRAP